MFPEWWGAVGAGQLGRTDQPPPRGAGHDSTAAVQFAFDSGAPVLFLQDYAVSKVTLCGGNRMIDGHNHFLIGNQYDTNATTNAVGAHTDLCRSDADWLARQLVLDEQMLNILNTEPVGC